MEEKIIGVFKKYPTFAFLIPDERDLYGGDFYIKKSNFNNAEDGSRVECELLKNTKGKKPEVRVLKVLDKETKKSYKKLGGDKFIEGVYSCGNGNFGFIDIEGQEKGYFVYGNKKNGAGDGDKVKAEVKLYNGKEEAIVLEVLKNEEEQQKIIGKFRDNGNFGFVIPEEKENPDVFIAGFRKNGAKEGDKVECIVIKKGKKNVEGIIKNIL